MVDSSGERCICKLDRRLRDSAGVSQHLISSSSGPLSGRKYPHARSGCARCAFATAVTELKRGVVAAWLRRSDPDEHRLALAEADRLGAFAEAARFRLLLVSGRPEPLADAAFAHMDMLGSAAGLAELKAAEADFGAAVSAFILDASERLAA